MVSSSFTLQVLGYIVPSDLRCLERKSGWIVGKTKAAGDGGKVKYPVGGSLNEPMILHKK